MGFRLKALWSDNRLTASSLYRHGGLIKREEVLVVVELPGGHVLIAVFPFLRQSRRAPGQKLQRVLTGGRHTHRRTQARRQAPPADGA